MALSRTRSFFIALVLSFAIYCLPFEGSVLGAGIIELFQLLPKPAYWQLAAILLGAALFLQAFLIYLLISFIRSEKSLLRYIIIATLVGWFLAIGHYKSILKPAVALAKSVKQEQIERDSRWELICRTPNTSLYPAKESSNSQSRKRDYFLTVRPKGSKTALGRLQVPSCTWQQLQEYEEAEIAAIFLGQSGSFLRHDKKKNRTYANDGTFVKESHDGETLVIGSNGNHAAWLEFDESSKGASLKSIEIASSNQIETDLSFILNERSVGISKLLAWDTTLLVEMTDSSILEVDLNQQSVLRSFKPRFPTENPFANFVRTPHGWVAWSRGNSDKAPIVKWSREGKETLKELPKGSIIYAAAVNPSGKYLALSLTPKDSGIDPYASISVFDLFTGEVVFKEHLKETSPWLSFAGKNSLAYIVSSPVERNVVVVRPKQN